MTTETFETPPRPAEPPAPSRRLPAIWRELAAFLRHPLVLRPAGLRSSESWRALAAMTVLHVVVLLAVLLPLIAVWQKHFALPLPDAFGQLPQGWLVPFTVLIAPVIEESLFRGWQTGRPRALWLVACLAAMLALLLLGSAMEPLVRGVLLLALMLAGAVGWIVLRKRAVPPAVYGVAYPAIYWLVAWAFAAAHLVNYPSASWLAVPMVLPQLWAAILLGFTRQRLGLPASILQHAIANGAALLLTMAG